MVFCTVEGLDGAGGTTLVEQLSQKYPDSVRTSEPSDLQYGQLVRERLSDESSDPIVDFYLFMADRCNHIEQRVRPANESGKLVISDRYADSTRAYQPVALAGDTDEKPLDSQWEAKFFIEQTMSFWNYKPDLTLYLDISVDTALDRADCSEKYEKRQFLERVKKNYDALADSKKRIVRIDAEQSRASVVSDAVAAVERFK